MFISVYNLFYTSLPVLALGIFDQDVNDVNSLKYPKLFTPGHLNLLFNKAEFFKSAMHGCITSCVLFFIPYGASSHLLRSSRSIFRSTTLAKLSLSKRSASSKIDWVFAFLLFTLQLIPGKRIPFPVPSSPLEHIQYPFYSFLFVSFRRHIFL